MERCKEVLAWKKTGKTEGDALRSYAKYSLLDFLSGGLQQAEKSTMDDAMMAVVELVALVEKLQARVAYLESRLEVTPEHDIDGIAARDATIHHQDGCISELKFRLAEAEDANKALRVRLGSELERANERLVGLECELYSYADVPRERLEESRRMDELKLRVTQLEAELSAERAAPEPIQCETCQGTGKINETLGGYGFSDPSATCPDCDGSGEIESIHDFRASQWWVKALDEIWGSTSPDVTPDQKRAVAVVHNLLRHVANLGQVTVTTDESGRAVAVTRQDDDHRILSVIWEAPPVAAPVRLTDAEMEAERDKQEPVVWEGAERWEPLAMFLCADENGSDSCHELIWEGYPPEPWGERWQKYEREAKRMIDLVSQYAAPPVITQHEPVTTVEDRYNADGKSCHITDDLPAGMPLYAAPPVAAPVRLTDSDVVDLFQAWNTTDGASHADLILSVETAVLRANGFKLEGEQ